MRVKSTATGRLGAVDRAPQHLSMFAKCLIRISVMPFVLVWVLWAQADDVRARMAEFLRYTGIENPAPGDVAHMAELWARAQQPGLAREERRLAFRDRSILYTAFHGSD